MTRRWIAALCLAGCVSIPRPAEAQFWEKVKETAENAAEDQALLEIEERVRNAVRCVFHDVACVEAARERGEEVVLTDEDGALILDEEGRPVGDPSGLPPEQRARAEEMGTLEENFDFEPGTNVLYEEDYAGDRTGDFPRSMTFVQGNWDVVERDGERFLRNTGPRHAAVQIPLPGPLPETFTIELDVRVPEGSSHLAVATSVPDDRSMHYYRHNYIAIGAYGTGVASREDGDPEAKTPVPGALTGALAPVRIMADGRYVKVYVRRRRVANVPNADLVRGDTLWLESSYSATPEDPLLVGPIRVAAGGRDLYDVLEAKGRVAVRDILFDTDAATLRAESAGRLREIGAMLREHPGLSLMIEGHTDDRGDFDHNMELSRRRAEAVKAHLVERFGIDPSRLRTMGLGPTRPVEDNATEEGRAANRRVELVQVGR